MKDVSARALDKCVYVYDECIRASFGCSSCLSGGLAPQYQFNRF
jgi:hypothetical protein